MLKEEIISYPELGKVYAGDYYESVPFDKYIRKDQEPPAGKPVFDIRDYGAEPGDLLNTEPIRMACEACRDAGGGTVLIAGGKYRSGTVTLYSHTTLFIAPDSALIASRNADDLMLDIPGDRNMGEESGCGAFLFAGDAQDITITGGGTIDGQGEWFVHEPRKKPALTPFPITMLPTREQKDQINTLPGSIRTFYRDRIRYAEDKYGEGKPVLHRPGYMVWLLRCRNIRIENILLRDAMCWTLHLEGCDEAVIRDVIIHDNRHVANTDGIDLSGCRDVEVDHCFISCSDDGLCVKNPAYTGRTSERLYLHDCTVMTVMNAFKIGTGTRHDIRDVRVENCLFTLPDIYPGSVSGVSIESCDGSRVENIHVRNIRMDKVVCPLYMLLNRRNEAKEPYSEDPDSLWWGGGITGVTIENLEATNVELPAILTGYADRTREGQPIRKAISDIRIRNYRAVYRQNEEILNLPDEPDEFLTEYPESNAHGDVDACGLWIRHADNVRLEEIQIIPRSGSVRSAPIALRDVRNE